MENLIKFEKKLWKNYERKICVFLSNVKKC